VAFIYANLGLGGGLLYVPILLTFAFRGENADDVAVPVSLTFTIGTALSATLNHHRRGLVDWRLGALLTPMAGVGAILGAFFTLSTTKAQFMVFFIAIAVTFGTKMLYDWWRQVGDPDVNDDSRMTPRRRWAAAAATGSSGFVSGSVGIGGGLVNVPLMVYILGRRTREAIGTSNLLIMPTALVGFLTFLLTSEETRAGVDQNPLLIPLLWPVVTVGAFLGSSWGLKRLRTRVVSLVFITVLYVAAIRLALDLFGIA
jgi:hypothetical protein